MVKLHSHWDFNSCTWITNSYCSEALIANRIQIINGIPVDLNGDSFNPQINVMGYSPYSCPSGFTQGQVDRMKGLLQSHPILTPVVSNITPSQSFPKPEYDLMTGDDQMDEGLEPNPLTGPMWMSTEIWGRNQDDGESNQVHENLNILQGDPWIYIRVSNLGCTKSPSKFLTLYWHKASLTSIWPNSWTGMTSSGIPPVEHGNILGIKPIPALDPGESTVVKFNWNNPPDPADYDHLTTDPWHFCLLSRIVPDATDPLYSPETASVPDNVLNNNNIAWKNLAIFNGVFDVDPGNIGVVLAGNESNTGNSYSIHFEESITNTASILNVAELSVTLGPVLLSNWLNQGEQSNNISYDNGALYINDLPATISLNLDAGEFDVLKMSFNPLIDDYDGNVYSVDLLQYKGSSLELEAGETFTLDLVEREEFEAMAYASNNNAMIMDTILISADSIAEAATYSWFNSKDSIISTSRQFSYSAINDDTLTLRVETIDGYRDYDSLEIQVSYGKIISINPSPAQMNVNVQHAISSISQNTNLIFINTTNSNFLVFPISNNRRVTNCNISSFARGHYIVALECDGSIVDSKALIIN